MAGFGAAGNRVAKPGAGAHPRRSLAAVRSLLSAQPLPMLPQAASSLPSLAGGRGRHFGLSAPFESFRGGAGDHASLRDIELRLAERLGVGSVRPSRDHALAALEALHDVSSLPSLYSVVLSRIASELRVATLIPQGDLSSEAPSPTSAAGAPSHIETTSPTVDKCNASADSQLGVRSSPPASQAPQLHSRFYFEVAAELEREKEVWAESVQAVEMRHARRSQERVELQIKMDELSAKLREKELQAEKLRRRESERNALGGRAAKEYDALCNEKDALEKRLGHLEDALSIKGEKVKEAQVELFIERKRCHEQAALHKELREKKREGEAAAFRELRHWQRALLRAHEARLATVDGMRARLHELRSLPLDTQLERALYWANGLESVGVEAELLPEEEVTTPGTGAAKLKVAMHTVKGNQQSTNNFFETLGKAKAKAGSAT